MHMAGSPRRNRVDTAFQKHDIQHLVTGTTASAHLQHILLTRRFKTSSSFICFGDVRRGHPRVCPNYNSDWARHSRSSIQTSDVF